MSVLFTICAVYPYVTCRCNSYVLVLLTPYVSECVTCILSVCTRTCGVLVKISPGGSKYSFLLG